MTKKKITVKTDAGRKAGGYQPFEVKRGRMPYRALAELTDDLQGAYEKMVLAMADEIEAIVERETE